MLSRTKTVLGAAAVLTVFSFGSAYAAVQITSSQIKDHTIRSVDLARTGTDRGVGVRPENLSSWAKAQLQDVPGLDTAVGTLGNQVRGTLKDPYANGPYPGATQLQHGDNSKETVPADAQRHTVWVSCGGNDVATGGGFRKAADNTTDAAKSIDVIASEPTQYDATTKQLTYAPTTGDPDGAFKPNAWAVEVVNYGDTAQVVRPWIICAPTN